MPDDAEDFWQEVAGPDAPRLRAPISVSSRSVTPSTTGSVRPARTSMRGSPNWARPESSTASTAMSITRGPADDWIAEALPALAAAGAAAAVEEPAVEVPRPSPPSPNPQLPSPLLSRSPRLPSPHRRSPAAKSAWGRRTLSGDDHHQLGALRCHLRQGGAVHRDLARR